MNVVMPDFPDTVRQNSRLKAKFFYKHHKIDLYKKIVPIKISTTLKLNHQHQNQYYDIKLQPLGEYLKIHIHL